MSLEQEVGQVQGTLAGLVPRIDGLEKSVVECRDFQNTVVKPLCQKVDALIENMQACQDQEAKKTAALSEQNITLQATLDATLANQKEVLTKQVKHWSFSKLLSGMCKKENRFALGCMTVWVVCMTVAVTGADPIVSAISSIFSKV